MSIAIPAQPARTVAVCWSATVNSAASCFSVRYRLAPRLPADHDRHAEDAASPRRVADRRVARAGELRGDRQQVLEDAFEVEVGDERASRLEQPSQPRLVECEQLVDRTVGHQHRILWRADLRLFPDAPTYSVRRAALARHRLGAMVTDSRTKVLVAGGGVAGLEAIVALQSPRAGTLRHRAGDPATPRHVPLVCPGPPFLRATADRVELAADRRRARRPADARRARTGRAGPPRGAHPGRRAARRTTCSCSRSAPAGARRWRARWRSAASRTWRRHGRARHRRVRGLHRASAAMWTASAVRARRADRRVGHGPPEALDVLVVTAERARRPAAGEAVSTSWPKRSWNRFSGGHLELADGRRIEAASPSPCRT